MDPVRGNKVHDILHSGIPRNATWGLALARGLELSHFAAIKRLHVRRVQFNAPADLTDSPDSALQDALLAACKDVEALAVHAESGAGLGFDLTDAWWSLALTLTSQAPLGTAQARSCVRAAVNNPVSLRSGACSLCIRGKTDALVAAQDLRTPRPDDCLWSMPAARSQWPDGWGAFDL